MAYTSIGEPEKYSYNQELAQLPDPIFYNQPVTYDFEAGEYTPSGLTSQERIGKTSRPYTGGLGTGGGFEDYMRLYGVEEMQAQDEYQRGLLGENLGQFQEHTGEQLGNLFSAVNEIGASPFVTGNPLSNAPRYDPYGGKRENFQTQQGYTDAQINHMNNYLGQIGSYFGNVGNPQTPTAQSILANAPSQGSPPPMPSVGMNFNVGGSSGSAPNPFQSFGVGSGGWGNSQIGTGGWGTPLGGGGWNATAPAISGWGTTTPNSLFGAGANATIP